MAENEIETAEEAAAYRKEFAAQLEAEERGEQAPVVEERPADEGGAADPERKATTEKSDTPDAWQGVPEGVKQLFDDLSSQVKTGLSGIETRVKQTESRIGAVTNKLSAAERQAQQEAEKEPAPSQEQIEAAAKSDEEWEELKRDFPEWAGALDSRMNARFDAFKKDILAQAGAGKDMSAELEALRTSLESTPTAGMQMALVDFFAPDWKKTVKSEDYQAWLKLQSAEVVAKTQSDYAKDALDVLDAFAREKGETKTAEEIAAERRQRLRRSLPPKGQAPVHSKAEADMSTAELRQKVGSEVWAEDT
jgi:hypothetical protein